MPRRPARWVPWGLVLVAMVVPAPCLRAEPGLPVCSALTPEQRLEVERLVTSLAAHDCCDDTLAACARREAPSRLVARLIADVHRRVRAGQPEADIRRAFEKRAASALAPRRGADMDLTAVPWAGQADAPVSVVVYACARCPFCSRAVPALYRSVTEGPLAGKARLAMRVFPIRGHEHALEGGLALEAARDLGRFWPYLLRLYGRFDDFALERLPAWAVEAGLDRAAFEAAMGKAEVREALVHSKKEGVRLGVDATPTFFVNGRRYDGELEEAALRDYLEEEAERVQGTLCQPAAPGAIPGH